MREPVDYIERTRSQYDALGYPPYTWVRNEEAPPFAPLTKPLSRSKVGLICSGGIYRVGQIAFHYKDDISYRRIPMRTPRRDLRVTHFAYDLRDARQDPAVVFPAATLAALADAGAIGGTADNAYAFMGGIYSSRKVKDVLAPRLVAECVRDEVDVAVLVPV
ncbi:MAG: hypothetical protein H6993_07765 [Pseudomonadales bacterium]|nr:hypothetical protein [Pseudomonadales bacterium]MCP5183844.1 hypothetical protein [Pseudomonadales bacterium]